MIWTATIGAVGGLAYAALSGRKDVWPRLIRVGLRQTLPQFGVIGSGVIGFIAGEFLTAAALVKGPPPELTWATALGQFVCGFVTTSAIAGYADRQFLRLAIRNAAMAPAADPATVRVLDAATPYEAYVVSGTLAPPLLPLWRTRSEPKPLSIESSAGRLAGRVLRVSTSKERH